jgi:hypothetical protein
VTNQPDWPFPPFLKDALNALPEKRNELTPEEGTIHKFQVRRLCRVVCRVIRCVSCRVIRCVVSCKTMAHSLFFWCVCRVVSFDSVSCSG